MSNAADNPAGASPGFFLATPRPAILAPGSLAVINYFSSTPSSQFIGGATVALRSVGSTTPIPALVVLTGTTSIIFVVPRETPIGPADVIYHIRGDVTNWIEVSIAPASFALFRTGLPGPVQAQMVAGDGSVTFNGLAAPAKPDQVVVLWGSGLGTTASANISVTLAGISQPILYAGASPSVPGVDQINFRVTASVPDGCYVPLTVNYGRSSVAAFLSKTSDGSPCAHPLQLPASDLKKLDEGGAIAVGQINMSSNLVIASADHASRQEAAAISFTPMNAAQIATFTMPANPFTGCILHAPAVPATSLGGLIYDPVGVGNGAFGNISLASGSKSLSLPAPQYLASPPAAPDAPLGSVAAPVVSGGQWTWSSSGGANLAPSSFVFTLPAPIQIVGSAPLTLARAQDQTLTWDGKSYDASAVVTVTLTGPVPNFIGGATLLTCTGAARAGALTIPKDLLSQIDPTAATLSAQVSESGANAPHALFRQTNGDSLLMLVNPISTDTRPVDIQ